VKCRHCGKQIRSFNDYRGETAWTHEDQMIGRRHDQGSQGIGLL